MKEFFKFIQDFRNRFFNTGTWKDIFDAYFYVGIVSLLASAVYNIIAFAIISAVIEGNVKFIISKMSDNQVVMFWFFFLNVFVSTIAITYMVVALYDKIINTPVQKFNKELNDLARYELRDYLLDGKISNPFRKDSDLITWDDRVRNYIDTATSEKYIDELTGCFNRKYFMQKFNRYMDTVMFAQGKKSGPKTYNTDVYALFMIDIDHFKWVNDDFGHASGDIVLKDVGRVLRDTVGNNGIVIRNGGEEFLVFCQRKYPFDFATTAEEINQAFRDHISVKDPVSGQVRKITCSVGFVSFPFFDAENGMRPLSLSEHVDLADMAMYTSKTHGRNTWRELVMTKPPFDKIDLEKYLNDINYGLKRKYFVIRSANGSVDNVEDGLVIEPERKKKD